MFNFSKPKIKEIFEEILSYRDANFPEYTSRDKSEFGVMLLWIVSVVMKFFAEWANRLFLNMFIHTSTDREKIIDNALEKGYKPKGVYASRQLIVFTATQAVTIPKGTKIKSKSGIVYETEEDLVIGAGGGTGEVYAIQGEEKIDVFTSDGTAGQEFVLSEKPFVQGTVEVDVSNDGTYLEKTDVLRANGSDKVFSVYANAEGYGVIQFGTGSNGKIPPNGETITVTYKIGKGSAGNVEDGQITELVNSIAGVTNVTNVRVLNAYVTQDYSAGNGTLYVNQTAGFKNSGTAYVAGYQFSYTGKTATSFTGVSGIDFPIPKDSLVSVVPDGIVDGKDLETNDEIRQNALMTMRTNERVVSEEDFATYIKNHPSVAWATAYSKGNIVHVVALDIYGNSLPSGVVTLLQNEINPIKVPSVRFVIDSPQFVSIDVAVEVDLLGGVVFDDATIISNEPLIYKGAKQNIEKAIQDYLSPIKSGDKVVRGINREITLYGLYDVLSKLPLAQVKNAKIINLSKNVPEIGTLNVTSGTANIVGVGTAFTDLEVGDIIMVTGSSNGNDGYYKVLSITDNQNITVDKNFNATETGLQYYKASVQDVVLKGLQIPKAGNILVIDRQDPIWNSKSASVVVNPSKELKAKMSEM